MTNSISLPTIKLLILLRRYCPHYEGGSGKVIEVLMKVLERYESSKGSYIRRSCQPGNNHRRCFPYVNRMFDRFYIHQLAGEAAHEILIEKS